MECSCPEPHLGSCHQQRPPGLIILGESFVTFNNEERDLFPFYSLNLHGFLFWRKKEGEGSNLHLVMRGFLVEERTLDGEDLKKWPEQYNGEEKNGFCGKSPPK